MNPHRARMTGLLVVAILVGAFLGWLAIGAPGLR